MDVYDIQYVTYIYTQYNHMLYTHSVLYTHLKLHIETCRPLSVQVGRNFRMNKWMIRGEGFGPQMCGPKVVSIR